jgi:hypothetical protein
VAHHGPPLIFYGAKASSLPAISFKSNLRQTCRYIHQTIDPPELWSYIFLKFETINLGFNKRREHMQIRNAFGVAGFIIAPLAVIASCFTVASAASIEVPRISVEQTKQMLGSPEVVIIDVRTAKTWWRSRTKILSAVREEIGSEKKWAGKYPKDKTLIFY